MSQTDFAGVSSQRSDSSSQPSVIESPAASWYCVRSTVGYEVRASEILSRVAPEIKASTGQIEVFCPQIRKMMAVGGKKRPVLSPLFPGYFFARLDLSTAGRYVASRPGVIGLVRFGDEPTPIPCSVIEELQATDFDQLTAELSAFAPGQKLIIDDGPFAGMEAQFVADLPDGHRAVLLLEYLNRQVNVVTERCMVRSAA